MTAPMPETMSPREKVARIVDPLVFDLADALDNAEGEPEALRRDATAMRDARLREACSKADAILAALASSGDHAPVAWRVKDFADGWIVCGSEQTANDLAIAMSGATVQPLYGPALLAEVAALRSSLTKANDGFEQYERKFYLEQDAREEAERKLAEAMGLLAPFNEAAECLEDHARDTDHIWEQPAAMCISAGQLRAISTFLSKEAERG